MLLPLQSPQDSAFKRRQIIGHGFPDGIHVDMVILMAKPVPDSTDVAPWKAWAESFSLITKPSGGFADHLQLALHGRDCFRVRAECSRVHAQCKSLDRGDGIGDVAQ